MKLELDESFQRDLAGLSPDDRERVAVLVFEIPAAFRDPARHAGIGLRKIHGSGIWEVRAGLQLRVLLCLEPNRARVIRVGSHDEVRRYLRSL